MANITLVLHLVVVFGGVVSDVIDKSLFFTGSDKADNWQPLIYDKDGQSFEFGEIITFRTEGSKGNTLIVGLWRCNKPGVYPFSSDAGDESFYLLEGEFEIEVAATGEKYHYKAGDIGSWTQGVPTFWTIKEPVKKVLFLAAA